MEHLKSASLGYAPALLINIKLGWKVLPGTNTLAYYEHVKAVVVKSFITFGSAVPNLRFIHFSVAACKSDIFKFFIIIFSLF